MSNNCSTCLAVARNVAMLSKKGAGHHGVKVSYQCRQVQSPQDCCQCSAFLQLTFVSTHRHSVLQKNLLRPAFICTPWTVVCNFADFPMCWCRKSLVWRIFPLCSTDLFIWIIKIYIEWVLNNIANGCFLRTLCPPGLFALKDVFLWMLCLRTFCPSGFVVPLSPGCFVPGRSVSRHFASGRFVWVQCNGIFYNFVQILYTYCIFNIWIFLMLLQLKYNIVSIIILLNATY